MLPTAIILRNYRSFARPQRFELRPLTLVYGRNSHGKSALLRSLPLVADSLASSGLDALSLEGREGRLKGLELSFDSLRYKGWRELDEPTLGLTLEYVDGSALEWAIAEEANWKRLLTDLLVVRDGSDRLVEAHWKISREDERAQALSYRLVLGGQTEERVQKVPFSGLTPDLSGVLPERATLLAARLRALASSVLWLRSMRPAPQRFTRWSGTVRWGLWPDGSDAPIVLAGEREVRDEVSRFYADHLNHDLILDEPRRNEVRVGLRNRLAASYDVDFIDTGEGLAQLLPVLTALAMARRHERRAGAAVVAIEDPEAHLHDNLQRALALHICQVAAEARPRIILETHSRAFVLAVVLASLRGVLRREDVLIYWVRQAEDGQSAAEPITLDELGRFEGGWPPDAFQEDLRLGAEIQDERDKREPVA